jgi:hypothetical protein
MRIKHFSKIGKPKRSTFYDTYWRFAAKRFDVFERRLTNPTGPWSTDPIISHNRFTNVFRASDRVSQYLIKLQYENDELKDVFFKTILFKLFNKIETYAFLQMQLPVISSESFSFDKYDRLLTQRLSERTIYSAAYIIPSAGSAFGHRYKHSNHLALLHKMIKDGLYKKICDSKSLAEVYNLLLSYPSLGPFLAFQFTIDLNYSELLNFSEMDFVVAGPGAKNGILKCFDSLGSYSFEDIIRLMADEQEKECDRLGLRLPTLWGRKLQLIDCQNLFCETDKYLRATNPEINNKSGRTRIKQKFTKSQGPMNYFFPPKWNINEQINLPCQKIANEDIFS